MRYLTDRCVLPVGSGSLVERCGASWTVLAAQASWTRHVVIGNGWRFHRLKRFISIVTPAYLKQTAIYDL